MKKWIYVLIAAMTVSLLGGCWSRREVEDLAIVSAFGVDRITVGNQKKYRVSMLVTRPRHLGGGQQGRSSVEQNPDWLVSEIGDTMRDAIRNMSRRSSRIPVLYHNDVIVIGQGTAREGIADILDFMYRYKDVRLKTAVFVGEQDVLSIFQALPELEQTLSEEIFEMVTKGNKRVSDSLEVDLAKLTQTFITPGWDVVLPKIRTLEANEPAGSQRMEKEATQSVIIEGLAVFRKDKLVGFLSPEESKGFLLITGKATTGIIPVNYHKNVDKKVTLLMNRTSSEIKPTIKEGRLVMEVNIKTEADISEVWGNVPVGDPKVMEEISKLFSENVKKLAENALNKAQKHYKADIFGFGRAIHKKYPEYWHEIEKDWYDIYPEIPVVIKVDGKARRTFMIADPFQVK